MRFKRPMLSSLGKDVLLEIACGLELDVTPRMGVAEDEDQRRKVRGPGLPEHLDPKDPRWFSTDYIEPPPVGS